VAVHRSVGFTRGGRCKEGAGMTRQISLGLRPARAKIAPKNFCFFLAPRQSDSVG
jgi:hypothetical protein